MEPDRRQFVRLSMRLQIGYRILGSEQIDESITQDLSAGGVRFVARHPLECGTQVELTLRLPECKEPLHFVGQVVWTAAAPGVLGGASEESEVGVKFVRIDPKDRALLLEHAQRYAPPEGAP